MVNRTLIAAERHDAATGNPNSASSKRMQADAARNGHVGKAEQKGVQRAENRQSRRIHREKTDAQVRG